MPDLERFSGLVGHIYDSAADPSCWPTFLTAFADFTASSLAALVQYESEPHQAVEITSIGFDPEYRAKYSAHYHCVNPWTAHANSHFEANVLSVKTSDEYLSLDELKKTEFYNDYLLPQDTVHQLGGFLLKDGRSLSTFTCLRSPKAGPFNQEEVQVLRLL